ncbi:hypothetical protein AB9K34_11565 [Sedimentitalea sp. XS_ASV28]|uniref:hypothetical protein n=1 Tax=Sedimentitalea sp. XS_ASV28 TaxID=3241296 RepID=UPI003518EA3F
MTLAVVNLGLPKSGTTTLAKALRMAGYVVADHRLRGRNRQDSAQKGTPVADLLYRGLYETGDPAAYLTGITALSEMSVLRGAKSLWPQMDFSLLLAIRAHHPEVRFLASRRDAFELSQSMLAWSNLGLARLPDSAIPGLPQGYGETTKQRMQWVEGHYAALARFFANDPCYLEFDIADPASRERISAFLGRDLPWWGRLNANPIREELRRQ